MNQSYSRIHSCFHTCYQVLRGLGFYANAFCYCQSWIRVTGVGIIMRYFVIVVGGSFTFPIESQVTITCAIRYLPLDGKSCLELIRLKLYPSFRSAWCVSSATGSEWQLVVTI